MKNRKELRIKIIGLGLCLLLTTVAILLLVLIERHLWLLFFVGPLSFYTLYRIFFGSSEERRQAREKKADIKAERRQWQGHRFFPISKRGRAAYLILCFEEALKFYNSENLDCWKWLLGELWQITSTWDIDGWVGRIGDASPETVLEYRSYQEIEDRMKRISLQSGVGFWYSLTEKEFISLKKLYEQEKDHSFFPVIYGLYKTILDVITLDWGDLEINHTPSALSAIDEAEQILTEHSIPLPQNQQALNFIMKHRDGHYGKPFDGIPLSSIL
mgnify:CR=1 FL=1